MGQKVHPYGFRVGINKPWRSRWFSGKDYSRLLIEDVHLKRELKEKLKAAGVSSVEVERAGNKLGPVVCTARRGVGVGGRGEREAEARAAEADQPRLVHRHSRGEQAGAGCAAGGGEHRAAAGKARGLPARDAQGCGFGAALRMQGHQGA